MKGYEKSPDEDEDSKYLLQYEDWLYASLIRHLSNVNKGIIISAPLAQKPFFQDNSNVQASTAKAKI